MRNVKEKKSIFVLFGILFLDLIFSFFATNYFNRYLWILFSFGFLYFFLYYSHSYHSFHKQNYYLRRMCIVSLLYLVLYFYLGFIFGFSKSFYGHSFFTIFKNTLDLIVPIVFIEYAREKLICRNKNNRFALVFITILLMLLEIRYGTIFHSFDDKEFLFKYFSSTIVPICAWSVLYTYLCKLGSFKLPLIFRVLEKSFFILSPVFPALDWFIQGSIGLLSSIIIYLLFKYRFTKSVEKKDHRKKSLPEKVAYTITLIIALFIVTFMLGFFKYEIIAILSNSMVPTYYRGDALIYEKVSEKDLKNLEKNSIIVYKIGSQIVAHRIINVIQEDGFVFYQTMGDNNDAPDSLLVEPSQILGVYVFKIKYLGYPSVMLNDYFNREKAAVETK